MWTDVKVTMRAQADDPDSAMRRRIAEALAAGAVRLRDDPQLQEKADDLADAGVRYVVSHFHDELAALVSGTIARWDADETSWRLELLLGRDLQFIRINGTVVGRHRGCRDPCHRRGVVELADAIRGHRRGDGGHPQRDQARRGGAHRLHGLREGRPGRRHLAREHLSRAGVRRAVAPLQLLVRARIRSGATVLARRGDPGLLRARRA